MMCPVTAEKLLFSLSGSHCHFYRDREEARSVGLAGAETVNGKWLVRETGEV